MVKKLRSKPFLLFISVLSMGLLSSQNLVRNPSFEDFNACPATLGNIEKDVDYWTKPTQGTTDYFNECSVPMGIPNNFNGNQPVKFGSGYAGLYLSAPNNYREYLQAELKETLKKGQKYKVSFYISLAEKSNYAIRDIGVLFSKKKINADTRKALAVSEDRNFRNSYNFTEVRNWKYFDNKSSWIQVETEIVAQGNENYMSIGNFRDNPRSKLMRLQGSKSAAYYYLDMVKVEPMDKDDSNDGLEFDKTYVLDNVLFASDVYTLNEIAKKALDVLYEKLQYNDSFFITVHAHTDDMGSEDYNKVLSAKRASAVAKYLTDLGLDEHRVHWIGHGGQKPIAENDTKHGKMKNRRAEFTLSNSSFGNNTSVTETVFDDDN